MQEGGGEPPKSSLGWAIDTHFGSMEALVTKMNAEGAALQGSGWVVCSVDCKYLDYVYISIINISSRCWNIMFAVSGFCVPYTLNILAVAWCGQRVEKACG